MRRSKKTLEERLQIIERQTLVFCVDECHLRWGDTLGYVWGPQEERVALPILNERERQTYYGALNLCSGRALVFPAEAGNGQQTVAFLKHFRWRFQGRRVVILWDRASYHRSRELKAYLHQLNGALPEAERRIQLRYFAPNAPEQNPIEDVWLAAKNYLRRLWYRLETFEQVKHHFTCFVDCMTFDFHKMDWYGRSQLV